MFKIDLLRSPTDEGGGAGAGAGEGEGQAESQTEASAFDWGDLDDEVKTFVGGKSPQEVAKEALAHRTAASRRPEQIEADIVKEKGYLAPPKEGDDGMEFFKQFAPEDTSAYAEAMPDKFGESATDDAKVFMGAAKEAGIDPRQFKAFIGGLEEAQKEATEAAAAEFSTSLQSAWGGDFEKKKAFADRAVAEIFEDGGEAFLGAMAIGASAESKIKAMETFAQVGEYLGEGTGLGAGQAGAITPAKEFEALEQAAIDAGGVRNLSTDKQARYNELIKEISQNGQG